MPSTFIDRRIPAILSGASLIAASVCISVSYIISAVLVMGLHFVDDATETAVVRHNLVYSSGLTNMGYVLGVIALMLAVFAMIRPREAV